MIKLCAFADEADKTLEGQIAALKRNNIDCIELRGIYEKNIADITVGEAKVYAKTLRDAGITVWSIGSPIGKIKICDYGEEYRDKLRHVCKLAKVFDTDKIRIFSFYEAYDSEEKVFSLLSEMQKIAADEGVELYHENEKRIYGDNLERVIKIMNNVKGLKYIYDPANYIEVGESASKTLPALHSKTDYFHIKDVIADTSELVPAGYGDGKIDLLIKMINTDKVTVLTVEPHLALFRGYAEIDSQEMKNKFHFSNNNESFDAAISAIKQLLISEGYKETNEGFIK